MDSSKSKNDRPNPVKANDTATLSHKELYRLKPVTNL